MRSQRRKTVIWELLQAKAHSPLFFDRIDKNFFFSFDIWGLKKKILRNFMWKKKFFFDKNEEEQSKKEEQRRIEIAETWDSFFILTPMRFIQLPGDSPLLYVSKSSFLHRDSSWFD